MSENSSTFASEKETNIINSLKHQTMATTININQVRESYRSISGASVNNILTVIYALLAHNVKKCIEMCMNIKDFFFNNP